VNSSFRAQNVAIAKSLAAAAFNDAFPENPITHNDGDENWGLGTFKQLVCSGFSIACLLIQECRLGVGASNLFRTAATFQHCVHTAAGELRFHGSEHIENVWPKTARTKFGSKGGSSALEVMWGFEIGLERIIAIVSHNQLQKAALPLLAEKQPQRPRVRRFEALLTASICDIYPLQEWTAFDFSADSQILVSGLRDEWARLCRAWQLERAALSATAQAEPPAQSTAQAVGPEVAETTRRGRRPTIAPKILRELEGRARQFGAIKRNLNVNQKNLSDNLKRLKASGKVKQRGSFYFRPDAPAPGFESVPPL
jgi:hypothetical protein